MLHCCALLLLLFIAAPPILIVVLNAAGINKYPLLWDCYFALLCCADALCSTVGCWLIVDCCFLLLVLL